jgi:hypothetical protein
MVTPIQQSISIQTAIIRLPVQFERRTVTTFGRNKPFNPAVYTLNRPPIRCISKQHS